MTPWPVTVRRRTPASGCRSASRACSAGCSARASSPRAARCRPVCSSRCRTTRHASRAVASLRCCGAARCPRRSRPSRRSTESRSASRSGAGSPTCGSRNRMVATRCATSGRGSRSTRTPSSGCRRPRTCTRRSSYPRSTDDPVIRTHFAGALRREAAGQQVVLTGWVARRRDHGGVIFVDLRDGEGIAQVVFREGEPAEQAHNLRSEWCVKVTGEVVERPAGNANPELATGEVEVVASSVEVLSESETPPFPVHGSDDIDSGVDEATRWRYRYLDLRRTGPARALRIRARAVSLIRQVMERHGFLDIETPYLTRSTPEGARDFLVPVRLQPGHWYALPQSPQLFKQLLMVAGLERYYQIARCFRDEDFRADRTPEFTQLDIEMSFLDEEDVFSLTEELIAELWKELLGVELSTPFPRITYWEAMRRYGSDKPDLRFELELVDLTDHMQGTEFRVFQAEHVGAIVVPGGASYTRKDLDGWQEWARSRGAKGIAWLLVPEDGSELRGSITKLEADRLQSLPAAAGASLGDAILFAAGPRRQTLELLGALRNAVARQRGLVREEEWKFLWIVDAPMFEPTDDGGWTAVHHPF